MDDWVIHNWISASDMAPLNIFLGLLSFACFLVGTPASALATLYYGQHKRKRLSTYLYCTICALNTALCLLTLPVSLSGMSNNAPVLFRSQLLCSTWAVLWGTLDRTVVFVLLVFSVTRTLTLAFPYHRISAPRALVPCVAYFLLCLVQLSDITLVFDIRSKNLIFDCIVSEICLNGYTIN